MFLLILASLVVLGGLAYRWPTVFLAASLASLGLGFYWILPNHLPQIPAAAVLAAHSALVALALAANAARYGVRMSIRNWPVVVAVLLVLQSLLVADLGERAFAQIMVAAFGLALPWLFVQVGLEPGRRKLYVHVLALAPAVAVAAGGLLQLLGMGSLFEGYRLQGATNAGWLSFAAYAGFAVAVHEAFRTSRRRFAYFAALNLVIAILTLGRMGVFACVLFALVYAAASGGLRDKLGRLGMAAGVATGMVAAIFIFAWPFLEARMFADDGGLVNMSGRDQLWSRYFEEFLLSPVLGQGIGSASRLGNWFALPHNEYLRILVETGVVGLVLFIGAVALWARQLLARVDADGRAFLIAAFVSLAVYATTDNVLIMPPALLLFAYFGIMLQRPRRVRVRRSRARRLPGEPLPQAERPEPLPWPGARERGLDTTR